MPISPQINYGSLLKRLLINLREFLGLFITMFRVTMRSSKTSLHNGCMLFLCIKVSAELGSGNA
jgi:hypothetical protein